MPCWPDLLEGEQRQFLGEHQSEKEVFVGVDFLRRSMLNEYASLLFPRRVGPLSRELRRQHPKLSALDSEGPAAPGPRDTRRPEGAGAIAGTRAADDELTSLYCPPPAPAKGPRRSVSRLLDLLGR